MKEPSRNVALVTARVDLGRAHFEDRKANLLEDTRGCRIVVQSRRAHFRDAECARSKLDQEGSQFGTEALTPERGEDRVPNARGPG